MLKVRGTQVAVAVALAISSFVVQADGGFYGSIRIGAQYSDPGGDADAEIVLRSWASRMGFSGSTDLDNGLNAFGKYEFGVDVRSGGNGNGALSTRHAYVGLKGGFGTITLGQTYHTWYNTVIGPVDQPWWGACNGCIAYTGRSSDGVSYAGTFGNIGVGATAYLAPTDGADEAEDLDGLEVGVTFDAAGLKIGLGMQDLEGSETVVGASVTGSAGAIGYAANVTSQGGANGADDSTGVDVFLSYGNAYIDVGVIDSGDQSTGFTLGYTKSIGNATTSWFELSSFDSGVDGADASMTARAALKYDWQ
ncbi:porin [Granulosicoccus sp.]|nr:porin [Granulosicoccus sp.]MDB4222172.1 porin [Granulosicoccus sp.]